MDKVLFPLQQNLHKFIVIIFNIVKNSIKLMVQYFFQN